MIINPRRMRSEGYCSCRVCVSVCLLFDNSLHEWLFASKNEHTYSAADGGQKICRVFSETAAFESDGVKHERKSQYANKHVHIASGYCWY